MFPILFLAVFLPGLSGAGAAQTDLPPYIHQCSRRDPRLHACYIEAIMHVRPWLAKGIPEIAVPSTEPFRLVELSLSLTEGPKGYRITLRDIDVTGVSSYSVRDLSFGDAGGVFSLEVFIPELSLVANYSSAGVLIMVPASGRGTLYGSLGGVRAHLRGAGRVQAAGQRHGQEGQEQIQAGPGQGAAERERFVHVDRLSVDLKVRDVKMRIERGRGENPIIARATNLLLRTSAHLVLDAMMPELRLKLADVFLNIANNIFSKVPLEQLLRD
ncbi:Putative beta-carotene-binding protein [Frankliniella fusca]|uniref:Beta-carotene-binding protein n=1 Tax=Frankliniella fusca TaxID=407009 RepID=A0AAE1H6A0_9NEOP|nr:Putative beta-carotene-binding protein [Frankliniella fusca]